MRRAAGGVAWSMASFLSTRAVSLLTTLVLARLLVPADFGVVAIIALWIGLFEVAADVGVGSAVIFDREEGLTDRVRQAVTLNLVTAAVLCALVAAAAGPLTSATGIGGNAGLLRLGALSVLLAGAASVHDAVLRRDLQFKRRMVPGLSRTLARGVVGIGLALAGAGAGAMVAGLVAGSAAWAIVLWTIVPLRPSRSLNRKVAGELARFGGAAASLQVLALVGTRIDQVVVARTLGEGALGLYSVAFRVPELLVESVAWQVSQVAFPALSGSRADGRSVGTDVLRLLRMQALYVLPAAAVLAILGPSLVTTLFGAEWESAGPVASAVAVMVSLTALAFPLGDGLKALGRQSVMVKLSLIDLVVVVPVLIAIAPSGIVAVGWARAGLALLHTIALAVIAERAMDVGATAMLRAVVPGIAVAAAAGLAACGGLLASGPQLTTLIGLAAGGVAAVATLRLVAADMWDFARSLLQRAAAEPAAEKP